MGVPSSLIDSRIVNPAYDRVKSTRLWNWRAEATRIFKSGRMCLRA
jgi:hypothetical protein